MSGNQALPMGVYLAEPSRARTAPPATYRPVDDQITIGGWGLFLIGMAIAGSAFEVLRPEIAGLAVHPVLIAILLIAPVALLTRLHEFPTKALVGIVLFTAMYSFSNLGTSRFTADTLKVGSVAVLAVTAALLIRTPADFRMGVLGLALATLIIAIRSLQGNALDSVHGAIEGGHKNTISLYMLPALLLCLYIMLQRRSASLLYKCVMAVCVLLTCAAIFESANRSGWACAALIGLLVFFFSGRWLAGFLLVALMGVGTFVYIMNFGSTEAFSWAMEKTVQGNESDNLRWELFLTGFQIGAEYPVLGVSPERVPYEMEYRLSGGDEAHNVLAHLAAGSGFICLGAFLYVGWALWRIQPRPDMSEEAKKQFYIARRLLRMMIILWFVRGQFTHEIIYSPTFGLGLGLAIGYVAQTMIRLPGRRPVAVGAAA